MASRRHRSRPLRPGPCVAAKPGEARRTDWISGFPHRHFPSAAMLQAALCATILVVGVNAFPAGAVGRRSGARGPGFAPRYASPLRGPPLQGEAISVASFGAVGDGRADDTAAIQKALSAAAANGSVVFAPAGRYKITAGLKIPDTVSLEGTYRSVPSHPIGQGQPGPGTGSVLLAVGGRGSGPMPARTRSPLRDLPPSLLEVRT